jgi:UDP-4-amino-4,6-dideoxy-N-acetyl-beta-L-altrosamine N-acetyltransferase
MFTDHHISREEHLRWFEHIQSDPSCRHWIITCDDRDVGSTNIYGIDLKNSRCFWGSYIADPDDRGKGIGAAARYRVFKYVFEELELNKICAEVMVFNTRVLKAHERFGLKREGVLREHVVKGGVPHDVVCTALLRQEWHELKPAFERWLDERGLLQ